MSLSIEKLLYVETDAGSMNLQDSQAVGSWPVTLLVKAGKVRLCFDAREMNSINVKNAYYLHLNEGSFANSRKCDLSLIWI